MIKRQINNIKRVLRIIGVHLYGEQIKSYSFYLPWKCMPKEVFSIILFTLYLVTKKCLTNTKSYSHGNSC